MSTTFHDFKQQSYQLDHANYKDRLRPAIDRLRGAQLRDGSLYTNLRTLLPIPVLCLVWLRLVHGMFTSTAELLGVWVTVRHLLLAFGITCLWNLWLGFSVYTKRSAKADLLAEISRTTGAALFCGLLPLLANMARGTTSKGAVVATATAFGLLLAAYLLLVGFLIGAMLSPLLGRQRGALVVGSGPRASLLRARLQSHYSRFHLYGCIDDEYHGQDRAADRYLGPIDHLADLLKSHPIEVVFVGLPIKSKYDEIQRVIEICEMVGVESHYMQDIFVTSRARVEVHSQDPRHFTVLSTLGRDPKQWLKRILDLVLGFALLIVLSPIMIAAALAVGLTSPGPVLFVQQRYGRNRKQFPMYKFRSMVVEAERLQASLEEKNEAQGPVFKLRSDPRVTLVGRLIRRTSIDELPQLFNVLRGDMSLVGPRPLPLRDVSRFEESWLLRRFSVKPGLTCLWQINGRSNTSFDSWIRQDLSYIDEWSLALDLKILFLTIPAVLRGSGAM